MEVRKIADKINETKYDFVKQLPIAFEENDKANNIVIELIDIIVKVFNMDEENAFQNVTNFGREIGEFA